MSILSSMTGFGRIDGQENGFSWSWELKSVNGRALDIRFRLPPGFDSLEQQLRSSIAQHMRRGNVAATLTIAEIARPTTLVLNQPVLDQVLELVSKVGDRAGCAPPRLDGLLRLPGVMDVQRALPNEDERESRNAMILASFEAALLALAAARREEGARLLLVLREHLAAIERLIGAAAASAALQPEALRQRFAGQLARLTEQLTVSVGEDRLAQELALLVQRADVREELDRLHAHVSAAHALLDEGQAVGRKLDFLCQEFNREANTICSKSADLGLTRVGLDLKAVIEQLREQVQNVE